ncbi:hypothetical protein T11_18504, partial [Trichinella zimbabwensis]
LNKVFKMLNSTHAINRVRQNASAGTLRHAGKPRRTCQSNVTSIAIRTPSSSYSNAL